MALALQLVSLSPSDLMLSHFSFVSVADDLYIKLRIAPLCDVACKVCNLADGLFFDAIPRIMSVFDNTGDIWYSASLFSSTA